jgi:hypothetical protein
MNRLRRFWWLLRGRTKLDIEIADVEAAYARVRRRLEETYEIGRWPARQSEHFRTLVDKSERQAAWLVKLLVRRAGPGDEDRCERLALRSIRASAMLAMLRMKGADRAWWYGSTLKRARIAKRGARCEAR